MSDDTDDRAAACGAVSEPMRALGLIDNGGAVRVGFVHDHGDDVDRVLEALADLRRLT